MVRSHPIIVGVALAVDHGGAEGKGFGIGHSKLPDLADENSRGSEQYCTDSRRCIKP